MTNRWFKLILFLVVISVVYARPKEDVFPVYRSDEKSKESSSLEVGPTTLDVVMLSSTPADDKITIDDIATVARASSGDPTLKPSVAKVTDQLFDTSSQIMDKDIRTPPRLKETLMDKGVVNETGSGKTAPSMDKVEANGRFQVQDNTASDSSEGKAATTKKEDPVKGVAVPVIMDEEPDNPPKKLQKIPNVAKPLKEEKKKVSTTLKPATPTTTPSSGLSTWILLSDNREATTPTSIKKKTASASTKKPSKVQTTTLRSVTTKSHKKSTLKPEKKSEPISALETMVKNQKNTGLQSSIKKKDDHAENPEKNSENKKVATIPPAIMIEMTETPSPDATVTESSLETTTKKKKTSSKKKKKNKNRRKNPVEEPSADVKDLVKQPAQPVGAQFYNFLSREIMPTVGLGLVGVLVTAGLAGLLGYNPFVGTNIPVRRTYESQHGYNPNSNYYSYNGEYGDTEGGKNEEVLFREVLSGMPEDSRYSLPSSDVTYPEAQLYNSQEQAYDATKHSSGMAMANAENSDKFSDTFGSQYDAYTSKEQVGSKYPTYTGGSYMYNEKGTTEKFKASSKYNEEVTMEKQPEALYRVSSSGTGNYNPDDSSSATADGISSDSAWHRIGSPMEFSSQPSHLEPGPRRLDLDKMTEEITGTSDAHKRTKRSPDSIMTRLVRTSNDVATLNQEDDRLNEIDGYQGEKDVILSTTEISTTDTTTEAPLSSDKDNLYSPAVEEENKPSLIESFPNETSPNEKPPSLMDVLRRLAQFKLRLGISFLKATTEAFGKYLEGVQQRVEDSMANDTTFPVMRYAWLGREASVLKEDDSRIREKRFQRDAANIDMGEGETS